MTRFNELGNNGNIRRRAAGIAILEPGSNSARTPPRGGGQMAYKADARKPKGLTRLIGLRKCLAAFRRVIVSTIADRRY